MFLIWTVPDKTIEPLSGESPLTHVGLCIFLHRTKRGIRSFSSRIHSESFVNAWRRASSIRASSGRFCAQAFSPRMHFDGGSRKSRVEIFVRWPYAAVETAPTHERDIAAVACRGRFAMTAMPEREYVLTGPESLTQSEQVSILGEAIGRNLVMQEISPDEARHELVPMFAPFVVEMLMTLGRGRGQVCVRFTNSSGNHRQARAHLPRVGCRTRLGIFSCVLVS